MRLATGISGLFLTVFIGIHSLFVLLGIAFIEDSNDNSAIIGVLGLIIAFLLLFGSAFSFKIPLASTVIFCATFIIPLVTAFFFKWMILVIWFVIAGILAMMSDAARRESNGRRVEDKSI